MVSLSDVGRAYDYIAKTACLNVADVCTCSDGKLPLALFILAIMK